MQVAPWPPTGYAKSKCAEWSISGAAKLALPARAVAQLGLKAIGEATVKYADQRTATCPVVEDVRVELLGRHGTFSATVEPARTTALIGAIVLEDLDFFADCAKQRLVPRDPDRIVTEIEDRVLACVKQNGEERDASNGPSV